MGFCPLARQALQIQVHCLRFTGRFVNIQGWLLVLFCLCRGQTSPSQVGSLSPTLPAPGASVRKQNPKPENSAEAGEAGPLLREAVVRPAPAGWAEATRVGSQWSLFASDFQDVNRDLALRCASAALREDLFRETSKAVSLSLELTAPCPEPRGSGPSLDAPLSETAGGRVSPASSVGGGFRGPREWDDLAQVPAA